MRPIILSPKDIERFWSKVNTDGPPPEHCPELGPCWLWMGVPKGSRYGVLQVAGRSILAHRIMWTVSFGAIPGDLNVLHKCDTPACVNPAHLFLGNHLDNMKDMEQKGRRAVRRGHAVKGSRLTESDVLEIRTAFTNGTSRGDLAQRYGVTKSAICRALLGTSWKWLGPGSVQGRRKAVLTESDVRAIRQLLDDGIAKAEIARRFGVGRATICHIAAGETWRHVS